MSKEVKVGRPTKYNESMNEMVYKLCLLGAIDKEIADFLDIEESTLNNWKLQYPKFVESIKRGKEQADAVVASKLFHRAKGYEHKAIKFATHEGQITDQAEYMERFPPDTTACIFWLKNRQPKKWRDRIETNITIDNGIVERLQRAKERKNITPVIDMIEE